MMYQPSFIERILKFLQVEIDEDIKLDAKDKWSSIKRNTEETLKSAFDKKNIITVELLPRAMIIPLNKTDYKNSKILVFNMGNLLINNGEKSELYRDSYNLSIENLDFLVSILYNFSILFLIQNFKKIQTKTQ